MIHEGQLVSEFKFSSANPKAHVSLLFHYFEGKTPSQVSYRSPGICISMGPRPPRSALLVLGMCRKGLSASCCLGGRLRHYSNGAGAELGQDLGRLCSECALPEPQGSPGLCSTLRSCSTHEHLHDFVFQSHISFGIKIDIQLGQLSSPNVIPRDTGMFHKSHPLSTEKELNPLEMLIRKVLQALMGHGKTMGITWIKV